jgi:hypothetical protein
MPSKKKVTKPAARLPRFSKPAVTVCLHPHSAEFFHVGADAPYSVLGNGPDGSDAAARLKVTLAKLRQKFTITTRTFDASGKEVTP